MCRNNFKIFGLKNDKRRVRIVKKERVVKKLQNLIGQVPALESIFLSGESIESKRRKIKM